MFSISLNSIAASSDTIRANILVDCGPSVRSVSNRKYPEMSSSGSQHPSIRRLVRGAIQRTLLLPTFAEK